MVLEDGRTGALIIHDWIGTVPQMTRSAVVGARFNTQCDCSGSGEVGIGTISYSDSGGSVAARRLANGNTVPAKSGILKPNAPDQFVATVGRPTISNSQPFTVSERQTYRLKVPMRATPEVAGAGYISLIFLGAGGNEIKRDRMPVSQGESRRAVASTDRSGKFQYSDTDLRPDSIEVIFDGDKNLRAVMACLR